MKTKTEWESGKNERGKNGLKGGNFERFTKKCRKPRRKQMFTN